MELELKHIKNEKDRQSTIAKWKKYRADLLESDIYQTAYEKWDLYLPFLERAYQLMCPDGQMVFIISDAYNAAKYARKSHEFFLEHSRIARIDFCSDIPLFEAGVSNTIIHFIKTPPSETDTPIRVRRWGDKADDFDMHAEVLPTAPQTKFGVETFKPGGSHPGQTEGLLTLGNICYISYGLAASSDEKRYKGQFVTEDVLSPVKDKIHPKPYAEGKDLVRWCVSRVRFLEWGTKRAPEKFRRKTFPELHEAKEKLLALRIAGDNTVVAYDNQQLYSNHTAVTFVPWHYLKNVRNRSIIKTAKYKNEVKSGQKQPATYREDFEVLSRRFPPKFILAVMNSTFALTFINKRRRGKLDIYPDDWKPLPIPLVTEAEQMPIVALVDKILALYAKHGHPLPVEQAERLKELEENIEQHVAKLYAK